MSETVSLRTISRPRATVEKALCGSSFTALAVIEPACAFEQTTTTTLGTSNVSYSRTTPLRKMHAPSSSKARTGSRREGSW